MEKPKITTITLNGHQQAKVQEMANALGVSRNRVIGMLVEGAKVPKKKHLFEVELKANSAALVEETGAVHV